MNLPQSKLIGRGRLTRRLAAQQTAIEQLRPATSVGVLTSFTTAGVLRNSASGASSTKTKTIAPRWG